MRHLRHPLRCVRGTVRGEKDEGSEIRKSFGVATLTTMGNQMWDIVARILPAASTIAVVALSIFNVGYFQKLGVHFLGLIDLNNLVYSFGLAIGLLMVLMFAVSVSVDTFSEPMSETSIQRAMRTANILATIGVGVNVLAQFIRTPFIHEAHEALRIGGILVGFIFFGIGWSLRTILRYNASGIAKASDLVVVAVTALAVFYNAGRFMAEWQMIIGDTYAITTKGAPRPIENVRLLRSSSAGFILLAEGRILFIPHSEITQIKSTTALAE